MTSGRTALRWLVATFAAFVVMLGIAPPALAAGELGVSPDGVHWAATLPGPLFDPAFRWTPGDVESASFFVRNQAADPGVLDLSVLGTPVDDLLANGALQIAAQLDSGPFVSVNTAGPHVLIDQAVVAPGSVRKVTVRVTFDPAATNQDQDRQLDLGFRVTLSQQSTVSPPSASPSGGPTGGTVSPPGGGGIGIPNTGSDIRPAFLILAAALITCGGALIRFSRRTHAAAQERRSHA